MAADLSVVISGDNAGAVKAIAETRRALSSAATDMQGALNPLTDGLGKLKGAFAALGTLLAGGALFKSSVSATNAWNGEVGKLAKSLGTTTEKASVMAVALDHLGISSDAMSAAALGISRQLKTNEEAFTNAGIQTRNFATGELLPAGEIMAAVNSKLLAQKNILQQNIDGTSFYGKSWNEIKATLKLTSEQMKEAEQRAQDLHLIVGPEGGAMTRTYKEEQRDLALVWKSIEIQLGTAVLPTLVKLGAFMSGEGPQASKTFAVALEGMGFGLSVAWLGMQKLGNSLGAFAAQVAAVAKGNFSLARDIGRAWQEDDAALTAKFDNLVSNFNKPVVAEESSAKKRQQIQEQLQAKIAELDGLRAKIAKGVSSEILDDDEKRTKNQISNAEKLRDALRSAWQAGLEAAKKASSEAKDLMKKAEDTRQSAQEKIADLKNAQLSPSEQADANLREYRSASDSATENSLLAKMAAQHGRAENAAKLADQASKDAERASKAADKLSDPQDKIKALERIAEAQAMADEARAKVKQDESKKLEETAASQAVEINKLDAQITELQNKAANLVVQVQIDQAESAIASLQAELAAIQDKTVTVTVNTVTTGAASGLVDGGSTDVAGGGTFAHGGWTGPGHKWQPAGIVHADEFVTRQEVVRQPGVLQFLSALNAQGSSVLPGFATGGLVSQIDTGLNVASQAASRAAAVFNFPELGSFPVSMDGDIMGKLQDSFARVALQKGGRR